MTLRSGIVGIERKIQEKVKNDASNISAAFLDMKNLIDMAKEMVTLASVMSTKMKVSNKQQISVVPMMQLFFIGSNRRYK